jgi:phosphatidylglycerophosphate synthase
MESENSLMPEVEKPRLVSPADAISTLGLGLSLYGASEIDTTAGVLIFGAGRVLDLVDGHVARKTYSSKYGANIDGTFDKLAVAAGLVGAWYHDAAPQAVLAVIAVHNVVNAVTNVYTDRKGMPAKTSVAGKYYMFGQNLTFGAFTLGNATGNSTLEAVGLGLLVASEPFAVKASLDYSRKAIEARQATKTHHRQKR